MKKIILGVLLVSLLIFGTSAMAEEEIDLSFGHVVAPDFPYGVSAEYMADLLEEKTDGKLTMAVHHSGALGWESDLLEGLQFGTVDLAWIQTAPMADVVPNFDVFNMPFVFKSRDHIKKALESLDLSRFYEESEKEGLKLLGIGSHSFRIPMNDVRPIKTVEDFKGLKMRTMAVAAHSDAYKAMGAAVTSTSFSELYSALQLGVVDGNENVPSALSSMKFYEVQSYLSRIPVVANIACLVMSKKTYDSLSPEYQKLIVDEIAPKVVKKNNDVYLDMDMDAIEHMKNEGIEVNEPEDLSSFIEATQSVRDKYKEGLDPWAIKLLDKINQIEE